MKTCLHGLGYLGLFLALALTIPFLFKQMPFLMLPFLLVVVILVMKRDFMEHGL